MTDKEVANYVEMWMKCAEDVPKAIKRRTYSLHGRLRDSKCRELTGKDREEYEYELEKVWDGLYDSSKMDLV